MANTYSQISIQLVFAVKGRASFIKKEWKDELYQYIGGIITNQGHKSLAINGMPDHIHVFTGMELHQSIADLVRHIKTNSSSWVRKQGFLPFRFEWQTGYGAFSYARSQRSQVIRYIENQEQHHSKKSFREEYLETLEKFGVDFKKEYLFDWY